MFKQSKIMLIATACSSMLFACGGGNGGAPDSDQDDLYYEFKSISSDDALNKITTDHRLKNPNHANISSKLKDWQLLDLTAYAMQVYDLSQQTHNIAINHYTSDLSNEISLLSNVITDRVTGFTKDQFDALNSLQDLCNEVPELSSTPFNAVIRQDVHNTVDATHRNAKVRFELDLSKCQYYYKEGALERTQYAYGNLVYDNFVFKNKINPDTSETIESFNSSMHGKWLVLSDTMGYKDSLGYWFIENFNSNSQYDVADSNAQVKTTVLRTDFYLRDGFRNFDHLYKIEQPSNSTIHTHIGAQNPYEGSLEIRTDHSEGRKLVIEFFENYVDIYIDDELKLNDVPWEDIRARKLDMTFDYAQD